MSLRIVIDDRELASRLAEMGYENLPPELLRALKKDIKKLVKHDITLGKSTSRELSPAVAPQYVSSSSSSEASSTSVQRPRVTEATVQTERIFHHSSSDASLSSTTPSEACIRAQLAGLAPLTWPRHCCTRDDDDDFDSVSPPKMKRSSSAPTFRVAKAKKLQKNDPVSLYHNYRKDWDKFNIPGAKGLYEMGPLKEYDSVAALRKKLIEGQPNGGNSELPLHLGYSLSNKERKRAKKLQLLKLQKSELKQRFKEEKIRKKETMKKKNKAWIKAMLGTNGKSAEPISSPLVAETTDNSEVLSCSDDEEPPELVYVPPRKMLSSKSKLKSFNIHDSRGRALKMLQWMIEPYPVKKFMQEIFEKRPLVIGKRKADYYQQLFGTKEFDAILRKKDVLFGRNLDVVKCVKGVRKTLTPEGERAYPSKVWGHFKEGCSVRMLNPQTYSLPVWRLLSVLTEYFNSFVGCNMYLTPAGHQGFAAHYDDIEAFVLQIEGKKHWKVYNPMDEDSTLPRESSRDFLPHELKEKPVLEVTLEPGDLLYFPRGYIHHATADDDAHSLHLTVSCHQKHTYGDFLMELLPMAVKTAMEEDVEFRKSLPVDFGQHIGSIHSEKQNEGARSDFFTKIGDLVSRLMYFAPVDATADQFAVKVLEESLPPVLSEGEKSCSVFRAGEPWQGVEEVNGVTLDINIGVRLVRYGAVRLVGEANEIRLHYNVGNTRVYREAGTKFVVIADEEVDVVEALISQYPQYSLIKDLPDIGGKSGKTLAFVTKLFEIGLLLTDAPVLAMRDVE